jgi:hypothetical protein
MRSVMGLGRELSPRPYLIDELDQKLCGSFTIKGDNRTRLDYPPGATPCGDAASRAHGGEVDDMDAMVTQRAPHQLVMRSRVTSNDTGRAEFRLLSASCLLRCQI